jgi:enamine deaminase RidA (YjgF/YER057c/UK114 family)
MSDGRVQLLNPDELVKNPAFSNVAVVTGNVKTVYVGGQDAVDPAGNIVGKGDLGAQTEQVLKNLRAALAAAGAGPEHVVYGTSTSCKDSLSRKALRRSSASGACRRPRR